MIESDSVIKLVSDRITESDQAVRAVLSCNSWFLLKINPMPSATVKCLDSSDIKFCRKVLWEQGTKHRNEKVDTV